MGATRAPAHGLEHMVRPVIAPPSRTSVSRACRYAFAGQITEDKAPPPPPASAAPHCEFATPDIFAQVLAIARRLVEEGFAAAGYTFVNLDDAWSGPMRSSSGRLQGDSQRFPHGMKWLADRLHGMGLKLGL
jgi:hypothetical protein